MSSNQERGQQAAQRAHDQGKQLDTSKMNSGERDAAMAHQKHLNNQKK